MHGMSQLIINLTVSLSGRLRLKPFLSNGMAILFEADEPFSLFPKKSEDSNSYQWTIITPQFKSIMLSLPLFSHRYGTKGRKYKPGR